MKELSGEPWPAGRLAGHAGLQGHRPPPPGAPHVGVMMRDHPGPSFLAKEKPSTTPLLSDSDGLPVALLRKAGRAGAPQVPVQAAVQLSVGSLNLGLGALL